MKKFILALSIACISICPLSIAYLSADDTTVDECSRELLLAYFPAPFVKEALKKYNVPEANWEAIQTALANKDKDVIKTVEQKATQMNPNPLKDPEARSEAVKLFRDTLFNIFADVMKQYNVTDQKQVQAMLDDIQQQKAQRFAKCMQKKAKEQ